MSDDFIRVATKEITENVDNIAQILNSCKNDSDISKNAQSLEDLTHKIKGLAPMMGQSEVGKVAALNDSLLKHIIRGNSLQEIYQILVESNTFMKNTMKGMDTSSEDLKKKIADRYLGILD